MLKESHPILQKSLPALFRTIQKLAKGFHNRKPFTIDGRLVGDIGEMLAEEIFDLTLNAKLKKGYDGISYDGRRVDVKATFKNSLAFRAVPDYCIGFKLYEDGSFEVVFNGPGETIRRRYKHRGGLGKKQLSFPIAELQELSVAVRKEDRIPRRRASSAKRV
jgi:hypothetical protein